MHESSITRQDSFYMYQVLVTHLAILIHAISFIHINTHIHGPVFSHQGFKIHTLLITHLAILIRSCNIIHSFEYAHA